MKKTTTLAYGQQFVPQKRIQARYLPKGAKDIRDGLSPIAIPKGETLSILNPEGEQLCVVVKTTSGNFWHADENKFYIPKDTFQEYLDNDTLVAA